MRAHVRNRVSTSIAVLVALLVFTACSGGGGEPVAPDPDPAIELSRVSASLSDVEAQGAFVARVLDDGTIEFAAAAESDYFDDIVGLHLHRGEPGEAGSIEIDLLGGETAMDAASATIAGTVTIDSALAESLALAPDQFHIEIHAGGTPEVSVRGSLGFAAPVEWHTVLHGAEETTVADANARGAVSLSVSPAGDVDFVVAMREPAVGDLMAGHIHAGAAGADGPVLIDLELADSTVDTVGGFVSGAVRVDLQRLARIHLDPSSFYANVHTAAAPAGVARGQLRQAPAELWAALSGDEETTVIDAAATGGVTLELNSFTAGRAIFAVPQELGIDGVIGAHVHEAAAGIDGGIVIDLRAGSDYSTSEPTGSAEGEITYDQTLFTRLLANPDGFYANVHTVAAPAGLVRGQLTQAPETFFADLRGSAETTVVDANAAGAARILMTAVHECEFAITMSQPAATEISAAHIHQGEAGTDGPVLVNFLDGQEVQASESGITGRTVVSGRTFARMLASPDRFYVNVHSAAAPLGLARGQCARLMGDIPPAGLAYSSPVTYSTAVSIDNNIPTSAGGAISTYSIDPPLPAGLTLDPATGILSGVPTEARAQASYTVTGSNAVGSTTATLVVTVQLSAPASLSYPTSLTAVTQTAITPINPSQSGGRISSYTVSPSLPAGLSLSATTGVISGTPAAAAAAANYTITGSNSAGSVQATINITVTAALQPPSSLSYSSPVTYTTGTAISANNPTISGGAVSSWSISPALPAGLSLNSTTGSIGGTPTTVTAQATYTVTASNAAGSTTANVSITISLGAPTNLSYSPNFSLGYVTGGTFTSMSPSSTGGTVSSYSISPALPPGISISASTGVISGSPSSTSASSSYTVTATNASGSTTATVTIQVLP